MFKRLKLYTLEPQVNGFFWVLILSILLSEICLDTVYIMP